MKMAKLSQIVLVLAVIALSSGFPYAAAQAQKPAGEDTVPFSAKGTIANSQSMGGYYLKSEMPFGTFMIVNQNPKLLDKLFKQKKTVSIDGRLRGGAEFLIIDKIDGRKYRGVASTK
jgi:hypothetical protein